MFVQRMVAGLSGGTGSHVQSRVKKDLKKGKESVLTRLQNVEAPVLVNRKKLPLVPLTQSVQVSVSFFYFFIFEDAGNIKCAFV